MKTVSFDAISRSAARIAKDVGRPIGEVADKLIAAHERLGIPVDLPGSDATELDFAARQGRTYRTPKAVPLQPL